MYTLDVEGFVLSFIAILLLIIAGITLYLGQIGFNLFTIIVYKVFYWVVITFGLIFLVGLIAFIMIDFIEKRVKK